MRRHAQVLPMNSLDLTWLSLDSSIERLAFHIILAIQGEIDPARLNQAVSSVLSSHPALRTMLRRRFLRHFREIQEDFNQQILSMRDATQSHSASDSKDTHNNEQYEKCLSEWINRPFDLKGELPFRVLLLRKRQAEFSLIFSFHHYSTDALRALIFIREVMAWYNGESHEESSLPKDSAVLHRRDELLRLVHGPASRVKRYRRKIAYRLFHRFVISLFSPPSRIFHDRSGRSGEVDFIHTHLNPAELNQIDAKARRFQANVNDLLLAACFKTIEKWNQLHGKASRKISIMVPVDVGRRISQHVISNQLSYVSPATMPADRADPVALLKKVSRTSARVIRSGDAFAMMYFTYFLSYLSFAVTKAIGTLFIVTRVYIDTFLLTNVGVIRLKQPGTQGKAKIGTAEVADISGATPVVTPWGMSLVTAVYEGNLNIVLTYRPSRFSKERARMFLELYVEQIRKYPIGNHTLNE